MLRQSSVPTHDVHVSGLASHPQKEQFQLPPDLPGTRKHSKNIYLPPHSLAGHCVCVVCLPIQSELLSKLSSLNILKVCFQDQQEKTFVLVVGRIKQEKPTESLDTQNRSSVGLSAM